MKKQVEYWIAPMVKICKYALTAVLILVTTLSGWSDNRDDLETMSCIGSIQLSLSSTGVSVITPEFLLTSTHASYNNFIVDIMGPLKDSVWCEHIGMTFMVSVIDTVENNSCMSEVLVLDKLAPTIECSDTVVPCNMDPWEGDPNLFLDTLYDNCTDFADLDIYFTQEIFNYPCDSQYNGMLLRTWFVEDIYGNATSCTHRIFFDKPLLDSIEIPADDTLDCPAVNTDPEFTGVPTYKGEEIDGFCQIVSWHTDNVIQMCGNSYKIMRQWNIMDWCANLTRVETQEIVILDTIPPVLDCPPNATVNTDPDECTYTLDIASITGTDNCSDIADWTIIVRVDGQFVMGSTVQLDTGTHVVEYLVWDPCDNPGSCSYEITVEDNEAPWATCDGFIVAIEADNTVTFSVSQLEDFFFYDNCGVVDTLISRMTTNCGTPEDTIPGEEVTFCCEDVNEDVMLVVQYSDAAGNTNWCMVPVDVQDKLPPEIVCEPNDTIYGECNAFINVPQPLVTDNCDIYTLVNSFNGTDDASGMYPVGTTEVIWTATDPGGMSAQCSMWVIITDNIPPVITCPVDIVVDSDPGVCEADVTVAIPGVFEECGVDTLYNDYNNTSNASDTYPVGVHSVTWYVFDEGGNSDTCEMTVTVEDNENPQIICPDDIVVDNDPGVCEADVTVPLPTGVMDNCAVSSTINDYNNTSNASDIYPVGTTIVIWTVTDIYGNFDTCSMTVTVVDNEAPVFACENDIVVDSDPGVCEADVTVPPPTWIMDNCGVATVINDYNDTGDATDTYPVGTTLVIWTVTDIYGNSDTCSMTVTVEDNENPQITCPDDIVVDNDPGVCEADVTVPLPTGLNDNCGIASTINDFNSTGNASDTYPVGTTTVIWTVTDIYGNSDTCSMTVTVEDNEDPQIVCSEDVVVNNDPGVCEADVIVPPPTSVNDNCGVASTINDYNSTDDASGVYPVGTTTVIWTVTDIYGNSDTCSMTVTVEDNEDPQIVCSEDVIVNNDPGVCEADVTVPPPTSIMDNCPGIITVTNSQNGTDNASGIYPVGTTTVIWTATDPAGNSDTCSMTVTVIDNEDPQITCPDDIVADNDPGVCEADVTVPLPTGLNDNCGIASTINDFNSTGNASGIYPVGTTTVIWTVTDIYGNSDTCSMTVTVEDNEDPQIICSDDVIVNNDPGACEADVTVPPPTSVTDNCLGVIIVTNSQNGTNNASGIYPVGTTTVIWTATDPAGNSDTCSITVTVEDNEDPQITCPEDIVVDSDPGVCEADVVVPLPTGLNDNCGVATTINDFNNSDNASGIYPVGTTTVIWTVTDIYGNSDTCSMTVTVVDNEDPVLNCPPDGLQAADPGECEADVTIPLPFGVDDNCGVDTVYNDYTLTGNASGTYPVGTTLVIWTVVDIYGNSDTCSMFVTVFDNEDPTITCPPDIVVDNDPGVCEADVTVPLPTGVNDNCGVDTVYNDYTFTGDASGVYPVGTTTVVWTVVDIYGHSDTCSMTVTVEDNENPTIICPEDVTANTEQGECDAFVMIPPPTGVSDNCEVHDVINSFNQTGNASGTYPAGETTVLWLVEDIHGNIDTCIMTVTVFDSSLPIITCPDNITVNNDPGLCSADVSVPIPMVETECGTGGTAINNYNGTNDASDIYPVGTTIIEWVAFNGPGNTDTCYMTVTVIDNENPTITCPPSMSVNNDPGECGADVTVPLPGVSDNCGVDTVFNDFTSTGNASGFYPVGTTVVNWTVTDIYGHSAQCSMLVTVVDNEDPIIICPPDTILDCTVDINNLPNLGDPTATDNCGPVTITSITVVDLNACNTGTITITYTATDGFNNESSCDQIITVEITNPLDTTDIIWPETPLIVTDCTTLDPDSLGSVPEIDTTNASCFNISVDYTDNTIDPLNYCYAIERIWTIIDSCQMMPGSSDGVFTFTQEIFVDDVTPPLLIIPADTLVPCDTFIQLEPATATDCGPVIITNDSPYAVSNGPDASGHYPNGVTLVTFTATDTCNNSITDILTITVEDTTGCICGDTIPPEIVCDKVVIFVPDTLETVIPVAFLVETVSDNCTDSADLFLSFALDSLVPTITLDCDDIFPEVDTMVSIYAIDESGNIDSCVATVHYLDVDSFCLSPSPMILAGVIETEIGEGVQDVEVSLVESNFEPVGTDSEGQYQLDELNAGYTYTIQPYYNEGALNGVNTYDLVLIQKHILGLQNLDSPFKLIASDANKSGSISSLDIIELRKLILGINDEFSNNTSWRFIDRKYDFPNTSNPFVYPFPEHVQVGPLVHSMMFNDFVGVKVGDVDDSAIPNQFAIAEDRSGNPEAIISYDDQSLKAGQSVTVEFTWNTTTEIWTGMQFALQVDERVASIIGVSDLSDQLFQNDHIGQQWTNEGVLTTSWSDPVGRDIENQKLIAVEIISHQDCKLSDIIKLDEHILSPEAYGEDNGYYKVKLSPQNSVIEDIAFLSLGQNVPNPFNESTVFPVESRVGQQAKLKIYNSTGREIHNSDLELLQGVNWIEIDKEIPGNPGVYYYEVSTSQSTAIRKMVYIR